MLEESVEPNEADASAALQAQSKEVSMKCYFAGLRRSDTCFNRLCKSHVPNTRSKIGELNVFLSSNRVVTGPP